MGEIKVTGIADFIAAKEKLNSNKGLIRNGKMHTWVDGKWVDNAEIEALESIDNLLKMKGFFKGESPGGTYIK